MSSWYIFSKLGFFPNAGQYFYFIHGPLLNTATIQLANGKTFTIEAQNFSSSNIYVQFCTLNGQPFTNSWISHAEIVKGGTLRFVMGAQPTSWGQDSAPPDPFSYISGTIPPRKSLRTMFLPRILHRETSMLVKYHIAEKEYVSIKLYDLSGRCVRDIMSGDVSAGQHETAMSTTYLPAKTYVCVFRLGRGSLFSEKVSLVK